KGGELGSRDGGIVDKAGYEDLWPDDVATLNTEGYKLGKVFEMNDHRCVLVGVCKVSPPFTTLPVLYTAYSQTTWYVPRERDTMSFVLVKPEDGRDPHEGCRRIEAQTGRMPLTRDQFFW